jgi:hypothetical protein
MCRLLFDVDACSASFAAARVFRTVDPAAVAEREFVSFVDGVVAPDTGLFLFRFRGDLLVEGGLHGKAVDVFLDLLELKLESFNEKLLESLGAGSFGALIEAFVADEKTCDAAVLELLTGAHCHFSC